MRGAVDSLLSTNPHNLEYAGLGARREQGGIGAFDGENKVFNITHAPLETLGFMMYGLPAGLQASPDSTAHEVPEAHGP
jgi:hypothetical protein